MTNCHYFVVQNYNVLNVMCKQRGFWSLTEVISLYTTFLLHCHSLLHLFFVPSKGFYVGRHIMFCQTWYLKLVLVIMSDLQIKNIKYRFNSDMMYMLSKSYSMYVFFNIWYTSINLNIILTCKVFIYYGVTWGCSCDLGLISNGNGFVFSVSYSLVPNHLLENIMI